MPITDTSKKVRKITVDGITMELKPKVLGGEYNLESVPLEDGTQRIVATFVGADGKEVVLDLPEEFGDARQVFSFQVDTDTILFSLDNIGGIWKYIISTNAWLKYDTATKNGWSNFQMIGDDCLISAWSVSGQGIYLYNSDTKDITQIYTSGYSWNNFQEVPSGWLIGSSSIYGGVLFYDPIAKTIRRLYYDEYARSKFVYIGDVLLIGGGNILRYYPETNTIEKIYEGFTASYYYPIGTKCLLSGNNSSNTGIVLYDSTTNSFNKIYETGYSYQFFTNIGNEVIISGNSSSSIGIIIYNIENSTIEQIYDKNYNWRNCFIINNDEVLLSSSSSNVGLWLYTKSTKTIEQVSTAYSDWSVFKMIGDIVLIGGTDYGVIAYNVLTKIAKFKYIYSGKKWNKFKEDGNNCYISSPNQNGILYYNSSDDTIKFVQYKIKI